MGHDRQLSQFTRVPDDVLQEGLIGHFEPEDLCRLGMVSKRFRRFAASEQRWQSFFVSRFGDPTALILQARELACTWKALYASKVVTEREAAPWRKPCCFELDAAFNNMTGITQLHPESELAVIFLVDGSGSVGEEDFTCMLDFLRRAAEAIERVAPSSKVGVIQFSNDVRVEAPLEKLDMSNFGNGINNMMRMNGGTNIAAAVQKAGQLLKKHAEPNALRQLVLLTDGRIDGHQAREAAAMVARLADEQSHVGLFAFGVGRGVDKAELVRIIEGAAEKGKGEERYVELCVRDEVPW